MIRRTGQLQTASTVLSLTGLCEVQLPVIVTIGTVLVQVRVVTQARTVLTGLLHQTEIMALWDRAGTAMSIGIMGLT